MGEETTRRSYLDDLREAGERVERGRFAVDPRKAREKLQKFQLADPHRYVLQFVQVAHLLDASWIEVYVDADEVELHFDGEPLEARELESVHAAAFRSERGVRARAVRHLAIGLTTAREVDPERIVVESAPPDEEGVRLVVEGVDDERLEAGDGPARGTTRIYLKETYRDYHLVAFFHKFAGDLVEEKLVREECRFSGVAIELNGARVSRGLELPGEIVGGVAVETEYEWGVVGIRPPDATEWAGEVVGRVRILQHGVLVTDHTFGGPLSAVAPYAIVESDRLKKNLSQSGFVRDEAWEELRDRVLPRALVRSVEAYLEKMSAYQRRRRPGWLLAIAVDLWRSDLDVQSGPAATLAERLAGMPIWPAACRPPGGVPSVEYAGRHHVPLEAIRAGDGPVLYAEQVHAPEVTGNFDRPVLQVDAELPYTSAAGSLVLPKRLYEGGRDVSEKLETARTRRENWQLWEEWQPWKPPDATSHPHRYESDEGTYATAVYLGEEEGECGIVFVKQGRRLSYEPIGRLPVPSCQLVVAGDLPVDETWSGVEFDGEVRGALFEAIGVLPKLVARLGGKRQGEFLEALVSGRLVWRIFDRVGEEPDVAFEVFETWVGDSELPGWVRHVWRSARERLERERRPGPELLRTQLGPFAEASLFRTLAEESVSLVEIAGRLEAGEPVRWVELTPSITERFGRGVIARHVEKSHRRRRPASFEDWRREYVRAGLEVPVLACGETGRAILEHCFGQGPEEAGEWLREAAARRRFLEEASEVTALGEFDRVEWAEGEGWEVGVALADAAGGSGSSIIRALGSEGYATPGRAPKPRGRLHLEIAERDHRLAYRELKLPVGCFRAVARGDALEPTEAWGGVVENEAYGRVVEEARRLARELLQARCEEVFAGGEAADAEQLAFWRAVAATLEHVRGSDLRHIPAFEVVGEGWTSHRELSTQLAAHEVLHCVTDDHPVLESARVDESAPVVRAPNNTDTHRLLEEMFPVDRVVDVTDSDLRRDMLEEQYREFRRKPARPLEVLPGDLPTPGDSVLTRAELGADGLDGEVALVAGDGELPEQITEIVVHERRGLVEQRSLAPVGHWVAVVAAEWLEPTSDYRGLKNGTARMHRALRRAAGGIFERLVERVDGAGPGEARRERTFLIRHLEALLAQEHPPEGWGAARAALENCAMFDRLDGGWLSPAQLREEVDASDGWLSLVDADRARGVGEVELDGADVPVITSRGFDGGMAELRGLLGAFLGGVEYVPIASVELEGGSGGEASIEEYDPGEESSPTPGVLERAAAARFAEICGDEHPLRGAMPGGRIYFGETTGETVRLWPEGVQMSREHPAVRYLESRAEGADRGEGESLDVIDVAPLAFAVSSLYTALSFEIGRTSERDDRAFYAEHIRAVARAFDEE